MANVKVPLKFQIFRGDELIREEVLSEPVIKVGKLASSHLRLEDDSVSRMHAVVEVNGPEDVQLIDLGSTRGTLVNGERITKVRLHAGDQINFGDVRVVVQFLDEDESTVVAPHVSAAAAATPQARPVAPPVYTQPMASPPPPMPVQPPPAASYAAPPSYPPPPSSYPPPPSYAHSAGGAPPPGPFGNIAAANVNPVAAEVEVHDGNRAIEVQAMFRGVVTSTRHLYDPTAKSTSNQAKGMLIGGVAALLLGFGVLAYTVADVGAERAAYDKAQTEGKDTKNFPWKPRSAGGDVLLIVGFGLGLALIYMGLKRRGAKQHDYLIGADPGADAPVAGEYTGGGAHALVSAQGNDFVVNVTPQMTGEVVVDAASAPVPLQSFVQSRGSSFSLPERGRARIDAGETSFHIISTPKPRVLEVPFLTWKWSEQVYTVGSAVGLLLFLLMIFSVPPDAKSLSLDLFNSDNRFVNFLIKPPEEKEEEIPEWLKKSGPNEQGGKGKRHKGEEGKMGKKTSEKKEGLYAIKKVDEDPRLAKKLAEEEIKNAGVLGVLKMAEGSHIASIFGRDTASGLDAENVLGGLIGNQIGEAYGVGGLGLVGTGAGGGGTGEGTIGLGNLGTIGKGGGGGSGSGYGRGAGGLGGRRAKAPDVIPGQANVRGSLDKEIIRRIIRRHINEVKYCYEQELTRKPELGGRVAVQFTIAATGQVIASVLQNSTMQNVRVETCVVNAVRRWEFPKPLGGGIVIVTYPFSFTPAGGGAAQ
jgi:TonB family protein